MSNTERSLLRRYGVAVIAITFATVVGMLLHPAIGEALPITLYFAAIMVAAWYGGLGPSLLALFSGAILTSYLFAEPHGSLLVHSVEHQITLGLYILTGLVVGLLSESLRASHRRSELARIELADANRALQKEIAGREEAERWLLESEQRFRGYFEQGLIGMAMLSEKKDWIDTNHRLCQILGYSDEDLMRKTWTEVIHPDDRPGDDAQFQRMLCGIIKGYVGDQRFVRKDGTLLYASLSAQCMRKDDGTLDCFLLLIQDITERKGLEADLRAARDSAERAKAAAEQANRAKDHFLAVVSHELRTPLTPVVMGVSMLQDIPDLDPKVRQTLEMVRRNAEMEARLIDDLLDVTRIARGKLEVKRSPVEMSTVINRAVEVCTPDIEARRLQFGVDMGPAATYWVDADVARLQQVLWNLLKNAIKFTPHGGCVGIRCRQDENHVIVAVNDSGIGIEPEALSRVFNAFEQAERSITRQFGGLGLGLAISKALVEMHGGTISAHSEGRDKGATFRIRLPLTVPAGQPEVPVPVATPRRVLRPLHILLVEDHGVTAKMMQMVLTAEGHKVETAGDVATALELADRHTFDLLLSDLGLPDGSGHELMRQLRERGQEFPGIALSGYGQEEDIQRSREAGFAAHLTKPASREAVVDTIAAACAMAGQRSNVVSRNGLYNMLDDRSSPREFDHCVSLQEPESPTAGLSTYSAGILTTGPNLLSRRT